MIIISKRPGQLGNSLFLFAHFIAFSIEKKIKIVNVAFLGYADYFPSTSEDNLHRFPRQKSLFVNATIQKLYCRILFYIGRILFKLRLTNKIIRSMELDWNDRFYMDDDDMQKKLFGKFVFIYGWGYRCNSYLLKNIDEVRNFFKPYDRHIERIDKIILPARNKYDLIIGLHVRHGDYANFAGGKYFYELSQYRSVMNKVAALFPSKKIGFLICSNSKHEVSTWKGFNVIESPGSELEDMYALSRCDYIIGPPSSYSMWASFYGNVPLYAIKDPEFNFQEKDFRLPNEWISQPLVVTV